MSLQRFDASGSSTYICIALLFCIDNMWPHVWLENYFYSGTPQPLPHLLTHSDIIPGRLR